MSRTRLHQRGFTLIEVMIAVSIAVVLMGTVMISMHRDANSLNSLAQSTSLEAQAQTTINRIEHELEFAQATPPETVLTADLGAQSDRAWVETTLAFPDTGDLVVSPGSGFEEVVSYSGTDETPGSFLNVTRAGECTNASTHVAGSVVRWAGIAALTEDQVAPVASFDGISRELDGDYFFRGDGTGFSYRVPTDPNGGTDFFDGEDIRWGSTVAGVPTLDGWSAIYYEPVTIISEAVRNEDLNEDGDLLDQFELGRVRMRRWDSLDPNTNVTDVALCPPTVLQEVCNHGGDLDADGFADPLFLWDPTRRSLRVRLFVLSGAVRGQTLVRRVETRMFLRNGGPS